MHAPTTKVTSSTAMNQLMWRRNISQPYYKKRRRKYDGRMQWRARLGWPLWSGVTLLAAAGLGIELWHSASASPLADALLPRLSLSFEGNLSTWFASSLLLVCALVAGSIAGLPTSSRRGSWILVTVAFGWASLDEAAELHESLGGIFETRGALYFDWVISAAVVLLALAIALWPWLRELPSATRRRMLLAGLVYFGGAVAMELPLGWWTDRAGTSGLGYALIDWVEETMELCGAVLMLRALLLHREAAQAEAAPTTQ